MLRRWRAPELPHGEFRELRGVQGLQRGPEHGALLQRAAVGQRQLTQRGMVLEEEALQLREPAVLPRDHLRVRDGLPSVVVDGEVLVEVEQVHQLPVELPCSTNPGDASRVQDILCHTPELCPSCV